MAFDKDVKRIDEVSISVESSEAELENLESLITDAKCGMPMFERGSDSKLRQLLSRRSVELQSIRSEQKKKTRVGNSVAQSIWDPSENTTSRVLSERPGFMPFRGEEANVSGPTRPSGRSQILSRSAAEEGKADDRETNPAAFMYDEEGPEEEKQYLEAHQKCAGCGKPFIRESTCCWSCKQVRPTLAEVQAEFMEDLSNTDELRIFVMPRDIVIELAKNKKRLPVFQDLLRKGKLKHRKYR